MFVMTNADRADRAAQCLAAYTAAAPEHLLPVPERAERVRLGLLAAGELARVTHRRADEHTVDRDNVVEFVGDLACYLFLLADGLAADGLLVQAAQEMRSTQYPVSFEAVCEVAAEGAKHMAAMLAACLDAVEDAGGDVPGLLAEAQACAQAMRTEEETEEAEEG